MVVPIHTTTGPYFLLEEEVQFWKALSITMRDNPYLENQNCVYDLDYTLDFGCEPSGLSFDPQIAMNVAFPEFPKRLDFSTSIFTHHPFYKGEGRTWLKKDADEKIWDYNSKDMVVTPKVSRALKKELAEKRLSEVYDKRCHRFIPIAMEMMRNKLRLDKGWWARLRDMLDEEESRTQTALETRIGRPINVKSSPEVAKLLYEELRLPVKHQRGNPKPSTQEIFLKELRAEFPNVPELNMIMEVRHIRTKKSNYINVSFDQDSDGELYLGYMANVSSAKTGRWAFSSSPKWRGSSPQTINKVMRLMYQPPPGSVFWQRDLSQVEARIVAWLSNCEFLLKVFASPIKIHKVVGAMIYGCKPEQIESDSLEYDISKRVVHAYDYMMAYKKFAITANIPYEKARRDLETYGRGVPEISAWHRQTGKTATTTGRLVTPFGRVRDCFAACSAVTNSGSLPDEILRDLVSYIPQSTAPDILNEAMYELWELNGWVRWHQQGHDSWLASGPPERTQEFYEKAEIAAGKVKFRCGDFLDCNVPGEFSWGYLWGAMLSYKPGEDVSYEAWLERATKEGYFDEQKIRKRLLAMV
jgi:DNA polymerase-1